VNTANAISAVRFRDISLSPSKQPQSKNLGAGVQVNIIMAITFPIAYPGETATAVFNLDRVATFGNTTIHLRDLVVIAANVAHGDNSTAANGIARTRKEPAAPPNRRNAALLRTSTTNDRPAARALPWCCVICRFHVP
jgi:hypothetical protein